MDVVTTKFVTFYSYKGGVGRTSALVNTAIQLALQGNNVVILDFDLEAPGTSPYIKKLDKNYDENRNGLLEYFSDSINGNEIPSLFHMAVDLSAYLNGKNGGHLWAINAGNTKDKNYASRLERLKWTEIFENNFGELLLKNFRNQIMQEFNRPDYVFIDSRTGISETAGVCTRYLGDVLVILTSLNEQNVNGTALIYRDLLRENKESILVASNVPVGMPRGENQLFGERINSFINAFDRSPDVVIYYYPALSLAEDLPALLNTKRDQTVSSPLYRTDPLVQSYNRLSQIIDKDRPSEISYTTVLRQATYDIQRYFFKIDEDIRRLQILKEQYSNRLLARIVLDLFEFARACVAHPKSPQAWNRDRYEHLMKLVSETDHPAVMQAKSAVEDVLFRALREYLDGDAKMEASLEIFSDPDRLSNLALHEISKERFTWPIEFLTTRSETIGEGEVLEKTANLYNLSHCLLKTGQTNAAREYLKCFLDEFKKLDLEKYPTVSKANFYFCAGLACKELGLHKEANNMFIKSDEQLAMLKPDTPVFSPLDYKEIPIEKFKKQLSQASKAIFQG